MAMDYLVTSVMDAGDGKVDLWYDFVWNRTRAIRKVCKENSSGEEICIYIFALRIFSCILSGY